MLVRLQQALGQPHLVEQMLLSPGAATPDSAEILSNAPVNLVIGYTGSSNSQIALDLTLWIAHQTRMATQKQVMVHVVYVVDLQDHRRRAGRAGTGIGRRNSSSSAAVAEPLATATLRGRSAATLSTECVSSCTTHATASPHTALDQADCILWQARCLAEEWRGSLEAHLRFGDVSDGLQTVADEVNADVVVIGCSSVEHPLAYGLSLSLPYALLGIPMQLESF